MLGIDRSDEPYLDKDPTVAEIKNEVFAYLYNCELEWPELTEVFRDLEACHYNEKKRPDYVKQEEDASVIDDESDYL